MVHNFGRQKIVLLVCAAIVVCILALYWPSVHLGFITYDDPDYVTSNAVVRSGLNWGSLKWAFTQTSSAEWHPLTMVSHMVDCQLFGLNPTGHHATNLVLHTANSLLLLLFLLYLTEQLWPSSAVAFLFALHPLNVETVAWISERKGLLSTFFGLVCLIAYARYAKGVPLSSYGRLSVTGPSVPSFTSDPPHGTPSVPDIQPRALARHRRFFYGVALGFLVLGLLSKPMLVTWPFLMLLLDFWPLRRFVGRTSRQRLSVLGYLVAEKLPLFALALASSGVTFVVAKHWKSVTTAGDTPLSARLCNSLLAYGIYISKILWPANLSIDYPFRLDWAPAQVAAALGLLLVVTAVVLLQWKQRPFLFTGWGWYLGTLVPVIGVLHFGNQFMADRYAYFTSIGLFIMLAWTAAGLARVAGSRVVARAGTVAITASCFVVARGQLGYWQDSGTLFRHAIAVNPKDAVAFNNLGFYYGNNGDATKAEACYRAALAISPGSTFALEKLAALLITKGNSADAAAACDLALKLDPDLPDVHCTLGLALMKQGRTDAAVAQYLEAIRIRPDFAPAHYNLGNALAAVGQFEQAAAHYRDSLRWDPDSPDAHNNLAYLMAHAGRLNEAEAQFKAALTLKPEMWQADYGLGDVLIREGDVAGGQDCYRKALHIRPDFLEALMRLAWSLSTAIDPRLRSGQEAVNLAQRACTLTAYKQPGPLRVLATSYAEVGKFSEAIDSAQAAQRLARAAGQEVFAGQVQPLIELFKAGRPYREPETALPH